MRLASAIRYDLRLQFRHGFYYAYLIVCIVYIGVIRSLPVGIRQQALAVTLLTDPSILGFLFLGGIILLEKGQKTLEGIFITPIRMGEYIWSKVISLTVLALLSSFLITVASVGFTFNVIWLFLGIGLTSVLFVFMGFTLVSFTKTVNGYLLSSPIYFVVATMPLLDYFKLQESPLFYIIPTQSTLTLIDAAFGPKPVGELILSVILLLGFNYLAYLWASKWFYKYIVLRTGAAA
ncbi:ABC transporter permease [bacterium]|nr:ABC transporter permease [bacterium]MBU1063984.1 ABC transporter permease [bacterium]MBU1634731.1 ABC transporter permease [bacterium]MBU1874437.1 ABC transporter permease [bacterium]